LRFFVVLLQCASSLCFFNALLRCASSLHFLLSDFLFGDFLGGFFFGCFFGCRNFSGRQESEQDLNRFLAKNIFF